MQSIYLGLVLEAKASCIFLHSRLSTKEEKGTTDMALIGLTILSIAWGGVHTEAQGWMIFGGGLVVLGVVEGILRVINNNNRGCDDGNET